MDETRVNQAATLLSAGRLENAKLGPLPDGLRPRDEREAYIVQDALHERFVAAGLGVVGGYKIGCTTEVMQRFLGIPNPCAGAVFESTAHRSEGTFRHGGLVRPGVECEIAVRLNADLASDGAPYDRESVAPAVGAFMAAIELVDDRWSDYKSVDTATLIADDFFGAGCVLGQEVTDWRALGPRDITGSMSINGEVVGPGVGGDIMGHPLEALAWLANLKAELGAVLRAGEFVLLGSIVETQWVDQGDTVTIELDGLGRATARFV
jgi:2-oxo-3-hexenedioate decarboxylase/2-keto-4-pentenoate hydratase